MNRVERERSASSERGAVLVQTALLLFVLMGFATYVLDHGLFWVSRNQAQNAADAAATAGAIARGYDEFADPPSGGGVTVTTATQIAQLNQVWREAPAPVVTFDCPPEAPPDARCVRVDVHRDSDFGNPLPMVFGAVLGLPSQGVRATATAQVAPANATTCLRPWAIPDRWIENRPSGTPDFIYEHYDETGPAPGAELSPHDDYDAPTSSSPGSGYQFPTDDSDPKDLGTELTLAFGNPDSANDPISPGWYLPLVLPGPKTFEENIATCNAQLITLSQRIATGSPGMQSASTDGFANLIAADPTASWNATTRKVSGSCAPECGAVSPRVVTLALFDVDEYQQRRATDSWSGCPGGGRCIRIVNFVGFFLDHVEGPGRVVGNLTTSPGLLSTAAPTVGNSSSFLKSVLLVR